MIRKLTARAKLGACWRNMSFQESGLFMEGFIAAVHCGKLALLAYWDNTTAWRASQTWLL